MIFIKPPPLSLFQEAKGAKEAKEAPSRQTHSLRKLSENTARPGGLADI